MFFIVAVSIYIPTNNARGFPLLHTLSSICLYVFLMMVILSRVKWYLIVVLISISLIMRGIEHLFHMLISHLYVFFVFPGDSPVKNSLAMQETWVWSLGWEDPLEKGMAPHSSTLAWEIPWTQEPGRLQSMGSLRVGHYWATSLSLFTFMHWRRKWQPTPVFLPGESQGRGSLVGCRLWGRTDSDTTEAT